MDTALLEVFLEVARLASFTAAARTLGYTQSAVSRQISALETALGTTLFDRLPRGVRLTAAGSTFLPHAEALVARLESARGELRALRDVGAGRLRIGAIPTADTALVPMAMAAFRAAHPGIVLTHSEGLTRDHMARLRAGDLDAAVVAAPDLVTYEGVELRPLMDDPLYVAVHPSHRVAGRREVRLADLSEEDWIAGSTRLESTLLSSAPQLGFMPRIPFVVAEWTAKQGLVAAGLGITLVPSLAAAAVRGDIVLVPLSEEDFARRVVSVATPSGIADSAALQAFLGSLRTAAEQLQNRASRDKKQRREASAYLA
jgi:DNA-binding transcriptional LysR family regulator